MVTSPCGTGNYTKILILTKLSTFNLFLSTTGVARKKWDDYPSGAANSILICEGLRGFQVFVRLFPFYFKFVSNLYFLFELCTFDFSDGNYTLDSEMIISVDSCLSAIVDFVCSISLNSIIVVIIC